MNKKELTDVLVGLVKDNPQLVHSSNILGKLQKADNEKLDALLELGGRYIEYIDAQLNLIGYSEGVIDERVRLLNEYYDFYDGSALGYNTLFSSQSKLRSTILEEFMYLLFRDYILELKATYDDGNKIVIGAAKAYSNLCFSPKNFRSFVKNSSVSINVKDQDFAICRKVVFSVEGEAKKIEVEVPILAIEVKTYLDKTMLESAIATAEKLKRGNPQSRSIVVAETYQVSLGVDVSYSDIDQIYVLRKSTKKTPDTSIYSFIVKRLFEDSRNHLMRPWADVQNKLDNDGVIL